MNEINLNIGELDFEKLAELDAYILTLKDPVESLINVLHRAQHIFGYIPVNLQLYISRKLQTNAAKVNGVVSFYSYFTAEKTGEYVVSVCMGTACYVKGADKVLDQVLKVLNVKKHEITKDGLFSVKDVRCIGACGLAPVVSIGEKIIGHVTPESVDKMFKDFRGELDGN